MKIRFCLWIFFSNFLLLNSFESHDYCIIGAGPSGLQMAFFLHKAKRNYVVFERNSHSASFFSIFPRHRQLISLNKRNTGERNSKFNLRHDWNSLLSDDENFRFTKRSKKLFPSADLIVDYFNDFSRHFQLKIRFNTTIENIRPIETCSSKSSCENSSQRFQMNDQNQRKYSCGVMIVATGLSLPNIPPIVGIEFAKGYENVSLNVDEFENQTVLILGSKIEKNSFEKNVINVDFLIEEKDWISMN